MFYFEFGVWEGLEIGYGPANLRYFVIYIGVLSLKEMAHSSGIKACIQRHLGMGIWTSHSVGVLVPIFWMEKIGKSEGNYVSNGEISVRILDKPSCLLRLPLSRLRPPSRLFRPHGFLCLQNKRKETK